jgi:hypothetical protein
MYVRQFVMKARVSMVSGMLVVMKSAIMAMYTLFFIKKNIIKILQGQTMKENNHPTEQDMQHPLSAAVEQITRAIK